MEETVEAEIKTHTALGLCVEVLQSTARQHHPCATITKVLVQACHTFVCRYFRGKKNKP